MSLSDELYRETILEPYVREAIRNVVRGYPTKALYSDVGRKEIFILFRAVVRRFFRSPFEFFFPTRAALARAPTNHGHGH